MRSVWMDLLMESWSAGEKMDGWMFSYRKRWMGGQVGREVGRLVASCHACARSSSLACACVRVRFISMFEAAL